MKFITEEDLRDLYRKQSFTSYDLSLNTRLTPGARQFLADRGIRMFEDKNPKGKGSFTSQPPPGKEDKNLTEEKKSDRRLKRLLCRLRTVEAMFLLTEEELLKTDVMLAQDVMNLARQFAGLKNIAEGGAKMPDLCCKECTGIKQEDFCNSLGVCFEINEFHIQLENGRKILLLHRLRCVLEELEPFLLDLFAGGDKTWENRCKEIIAKGNQIINTLSLMICDAVGGKTCQRKE